MITDCSSLRHRYRLAAALVPRSIQSYKLRIQLQTIKKNEISSFLWKIMPDRLHHIFIIVIVIVIIIITIIYRPSS
jgi:hypothetical protein